MLLKGMEEGSDGEGGKAASVPEASGKQGLESKEVPAGRSGLRIVYWLFILLMFSIAGTCIWLFGHALLHQGAAAAAAAVEKVSQQKEGQASSPSGGQAQNEAANTVGLPRQDRWMLVVVVGLISLVPLSLLVLQLFRAQSRKADPTETLLHLSVHAVPYGILSLSMLFEYHKINEGKAEGAAALASIMILFILSELGLILFSEVREARSASDALSEVLKGANETQSRLESGLSNMHTGINALPWVGRYAQLTKRSVAELDLVSAIGDLLKTYEILLSDEPGLRHLLINVLLSQYLAEEKKDITGELESDRLPEGLSLPASSYVGRASILATNVTFYADFLRKSVQVLAKEVGGLAKPERRPCIVAITTALPGQFWNWPISSEMEIEYPPISSYREAQFDAVADKNLRVFRTILMTDEPNVASSSSSSSTALRNIDEWDNEKNLFFVSFEKVDGGFRPMTRKDANYPLSEENLPHRQKWAVGKQGGQSRNVVWLAKVKEKPSFQYERLWDFYCRKMHRVVQGQNLLKAGRTEVLNITRETFFAPWGRGFAGCSDLMFLGTSGFNNDDVWENSNGVEWGMAIMTSMSSTTETMFMLVVHEPELIKGLWKYVADVRNANKGRSFSDSDFI